MTKREELREKVLTKLIETGDTHLKNSEWELGSTKLFFSC